MAKKKDETTNILLEAGTNEVEIVEFSIRDNLYGINVAKVREIIRYTPEEIIEVPKAHSSLQGIINLRDNVVPVVNLPKYLNKEELTEEEAANTRIIVCDFNKVVVGFWVSSVARIHRLSWKQVEPPSSVVTSGENYVVAVVRMGEKLILILDFEKITSDISPESSMQKTGDTHFTAKEVEFDRTKKMVYVADDSPFIRDMVVDYLKEAGYQTKAFTNGDEAWQAISAIEGDVDAKVQLLVTDIEMPQMDGLHLVKNIKSDTRLRKLPCVVFSSLITKELALKCKSVGADAEVSKPEIENMVELVDKLIL